MRKFTSLLILIVVVAALVFVVFKLIDRTSKSTTNQVTPHITSLSIEKPDFVVRGRGLSKVEIWGIPTGTDVTEALYHLLGEAESGTINDEEQTLRVPIPQEPLLLTEIFAKGFDKNGEEAARVALGVKGASALYEALWLSGEETEGTLAVGESDDFNGLTIELLDILEDSRCPSDVECIQAGRVSVEFGLSTEATSTTATLGSDESGIPFGGYFVSIKSVESESLSTEEIETEEYLVTFLVVRDIKL